MPESCEASVTLAGDLHARPAGALAVAAAKFASSVRADRGREPGRRQSVLAIMGLGASSGQQVTVRAAGPDAQEAVARMIGILAKATKVGG